jgi:serine/threonine protein kinase
VGVQAAALRTLRCLFSTERNRRLFKRLFPPALFAAFIDVGHYVRDTRPYSHLIRSVVCSLSDEAVQRMAEALADVNLVSGPAQRIVRGYALHELLGRGAFGSVFHVRREGGGGGEFAMKEIELTQVELATGGWANSVGSCCGVGGAGAVSGAAEGAGGSGVSGGGTSAGGDDAVSAVRREVSILSQLSHPNIIQYHESFCEGGRLYIVTELVDGATLLDHLTALREKRDRLPEERVWQIFVQLLLALRYCHKQKGIVHRDLTPANVLMTADGSIKLADFGLARRRDTESALLESVVGTVIYQPPEIVKHEVCACALLCCCAAVLLCRAVLCVAAVPSATALPCATAAFASMVWHGVVPLRDLPSTRSGARLLTGANPHAPRQSDLRLASTPSLPVLATRAPRPCACLVACCALCASALCPCNAMPALPACARPCDPCAQRKRSATGALARRAPACRPTRTRRTYGHSAASSTR